MFRVAMFRGKWLSGAAFALALFGSPPAAPAWTFKVLHHFAGGANDGAPYFGSLVEDKQGNLFGRTAHGGAYGDGTVFRLAPHGTLTLLHSFTGGQSNDGIEPEGGVIRDRAGNLYGTTYDGGENGDGTVFKIAPDGTETILHSFDDADGSGPEGSLTWDTSGNLRGTAIEGGNDDCVYGCGTAFLITPDGAFSLLHVFQQNEGASPWGTLVKDRAGNFHGVTEGILSDLGEIFQLAPDGTETTLFSFGNSPGAYPAGIVRDKAGNLYGTAQYGGKRGDGLVFEFTPDGTFNVLHSFKGTDGSQPSARVIRDKAGNLYGTTYIGGTDDAGVVFERKANGRLKVLHSFSPDTDGRWLWAGLLMDDAGDLYGTTVRGGAYDGGTAFELAK